MKIKMKQSIFSIMTMVLIAFVSCQSNDRTANSGVQHFRKMRFSETSFDKFAGLRPLTAEQAESINNYKFTYDDDGRLVSLEYCRGDELLNGSSTGAPKIEITYEGNKEIHRYYDINGQQIMRGGYYTAQYELDDEGVREHLRFLDKDGNPVENFLGIASYDWEVLANGQVKENRYNLDGEETVMSEFCPFYELRFNYNDDGFVTMMANYQGDTMYNCTVENCGDIGVSYFSFDYNDEGDMTTFTVESLSGQLSNLYWGWARTENNYDQYGNLVERVQYDQDNEPLGGMTVPVTQMAYDEHGAVVEQKNMDINRNLINDPRSGIAVRKYTYNESGHPVDTLSYNADMELASL